MTLSEFLQHLGTKPEWGGAGAVSAGSRARGGDTPLHAAIWAGDDDAARALLDAGADVNAAGEDAYTPLHAAIAQRNAPLARRLTDRGGSWETVNGFGCSVREAARRSDDAGIRALFEDEQAVSALPGRIGHFRLESGHHSDLWLDLQRLCSRPEFIRPRAVEIGRRLAPHAVDVICGPLVEGAFVALLVASELGALYCYTEPFRPAEGAGDGLFPVKYRLPPVVRPLVAGKRVAIVNDVIGAGSAVLGTANDLASHGATVVAFGALAVLGTSAAALAGRHGVPLETLAAFPTTIWTPDACPLCQSRVPIEDPATAV